MLFLYINHNPNYSILSSCILSNRIYDRSAPPAFLSGQMGAPAVLL